MAKVARICNKECDYCLGVQMDRWFDLPPEVWLENGYSVAQFKKLIEENGGGRVDCSYLPPLAVSFLGTQCRVPDELFNSGMGVKLIK